MTNDKIEDVVAVYDTDFYQLFADARAIKASVKPSAKLMKHPVESGNSIVDNRIVEPLTIELHFILLAETYIDTYNQILQTFNGSSLLYVQTKTGIYGNMAMQACPHEEDPSKFDTIAITIPFEEVKIVVSTTSELPESMRTKKNGTVNGQPATKTESNQATQKSSTGYKVLQYFGGPA